MAEKTPLLTLTVIATAVIAAETFVTYAGAVPTQGANVLGVATSAAKADDALAVDADGVAIVVSGGVFAAGAAVSTDAAGKAIAVPGSAPNATVGRALDASIASGQRVRVRLIPN